MGIFILKIDRGGEIDHTFSHFTVTVVCVAPGCLGPGLLTVVGAGAETYRR